MNKQAETILQRIDTHERGITRHPDASKPLPRECEVEAFNKARDAVMALLDATNVMGCDDAVKLGVIQGILRTHRYLQGQGIVAILTALGEFGRLPGNKDPRNAHAKETCESLVSALRERIYWPD
jgi:hypothetical protein